MGISEKKMREILGKDIVVSDVVNERLKETYMQLEEKQSVSGNRRFYRRNLCTAAAILLVCVAIPSVVYASVRSGFFEGMFGNETKQSTKVIHSEIDNGKGGTVAVEIPSKEYVPVDEAKAKDLLGKWVMDEPVTVQIGEHTLTVESFAYDKHGALMYFTLKKEDGITALAGNENTNLTKGAYFTEDADFYFCVEASDNIVGCDNIYVDTEKSTDDCMYCYSYILWPKALAKDASIQLVIDKYPGSVKETNGSISEEEKQAWWDQVKIEQISLSGKGQIPNQCVDLGENGYLEYSPISICVDMSKGLGLSAEEAADPYYMNHLEIKYKDGSSYVISDNTKNINNSGYVLGTDEGYKAVFNRLVDPQQIDEIIVNERSFPVQ